MMRTSPLTGPLVLVLLAGGTNVLRDLVRFYPALMIAVAIVAATVVLRPPGNVHRDKHNPH